MLQLMKIGQKLISATLHHAYTAVQENQEGRVSGLYLSIFSLLLTLHRLFHGNLVFDFMAPMKLLDMCACAMSASLRTCGTLLLRAIRIA